MMGAIALELDWIDAVRLTHVSLSVASNDMELVANSLPGVAALIRSTFTSEAFPIPRIHDQRDVTSCLCISLRALTYL